ncbi:MAG: helix-turn-helix transcriptional regulator [Clostridia bacterium]|nr:helix-turn-helix transcriptional regulator [Clostridia bacterium]
MGKMSFNMKLRTLRKMKGMKQRELAEALGVALSTIAMWETANREPNFAMIRKIADYFSVSIEQLVNDDIELEFGSNNTLKNNARFDEEIISLRNMLHTRPEMRMLFSVSKSASKEDIEKAIKIIEALKQF